jgi:hypothetical protein
MPARRPLRLTLKLDGPLVEEHRLPLSELLRVGKQLRDSLRDVAIVLLHDGPSGKAGRSKKAIEKSVDLRVVASPRPGSFTLELEAPPEAPPTHEQLDVDGEPGLPDRAIIAFLDGLDELNEEAEQLPTGFDRGVLRAIVPFRTALRKGLSEIDLSATNGAERHEAKITAEKVQTAARLIKKPVRAEAAVEGVLQMVDFGSLEFRIDRPPLASVSVYFEEKYRDLVHDAVRQYVRVAGEGQFEPDSNEPSKVWATRIEVLYETLELDVNAFWRERAVEELASEQGAREYVLPEAIESDPWRDDVEAAALIEAIRSTE